MKWFKERSGQIAGVIVVFAALIALGGAIAVGVLQKQNNTPTPTPPPTGSSQQQTPKSTPGSIASNNTIDHGTSVQQGSIDKFTSPVPSDTPFPSFTPVPAATHVPTLTDTPPAGGQNPGGTNPGGSNPGGTTPPAGGGNPGSGITPPPQATQPPQANPNNCTTDSQEEGTATGCNGNLNGTHFKETFTVSPGSPQSAMNNYPRWYSQPALQGIFGWDFASQPMAAQHDASCGPPPATHQITAFEDTVFLCKDHIMTAVSPPDGGTSSGIVGLKPNHMVDLSQGEATIRIDVSTASPSAGDWWEIWFTPWDDQLVSPTDHWFHHAGPPKNAVQLEIADFPPSNTKNWSHQVYHDYAMQIPQFDNQGSTIAFWAGPDFRDKVPVSDTRRDTYEVRMTQTHMKLLVKSPKTNDQLVLVDEFDIPGGFGSNAAIVQFQQSNYEPRKNRKIGCASDNCPDVTVPATWHWDNAEIFPAIPYQLIGVNEFQIVNGRNPHTLTFKAPAPAGARLLFNGQSVNNSFTLTFNDGTTRSAVAVRPRNGIGAGPGGPGIDPDFLTYTVDVPAGATSATIDGVDYCTPDACGSVIGPYGVWEAQNFHIIAK